MSDGYSDYLKHRRNMVGRAPYEWQDHVAPEHWGKFVELSAKYRERVTPRQADAAWCARELGDVPYRHTGGLWELVAAVGVDGPLPVRVPVESLGRDE